MNPLSTVEIARHYEVFRKSVQPFAGIGSRVFKKRVSIVEPWLKEQSIVLLYSWRGVGKTWFVLSLARAVCMGENFGPWKTNPVDILYIDGEGVGEDLQNRARLLGPMEDAKSNLYYQNGDDLAELGAINLCDLTWRLHVEKLCLELKIQLVILDNLFSLTSGLPINDTESWSGINSWMMGLRRKGVAVLLLHHTGKDPRKGPMGTSAMETNIDTSLALVQPKDYNKEVDGCRFIHDFTKARIPHEAMPLLHRLEWVQRPDPGTGCYGFQLKKLAEANSNSKDRILQGIADGNGESDAELAKGLGVSRQWFSVCKKQNQQAGYLDQKGKVTDSGRNRIEEIFP